MANPTKGPGSRPSDSRIKSVRRSVQASFRFGHDRPLAWKLAQRYGITESRAEQLINFYYGRTNSVQANQRSDNPITRRERDQLAAKALGIFGVGQAFGRGFGFGNILTLP